jgi:CDP-glycerol glycerophosphotransferase
MGRRALWHLKNGARHVVTVIGKRFPSVLTVTREAYTRLRRWSYRRMCRRIPVDRSVAVFESFTGRGYSCSPRALYRELLRNSGAGVSTMVWAFRTPIAQALRDAGVCEVRGLDEVVAVPPLGGDIRALFSPEALEQLSHAVVVPWGSPEYRRTYACAGLWVSNSVIPEYLSPRDGQTYVQTWHGTPLKRLGCDIVPTVSGNALYSARDMHHRYSREGARFTHVLSPSRFTSEKLASAFDLVSTGRTSVIIEEGYPRNDALSTFTAADVARIKARLGVPEDKKVVLYAPTWRDNQHTSGVGYTYEAEVDFDALRASLGNDYVVLFRAHYFIANAFDFAAYGGFVIDVSKVDDINDLYVISDVLVTDYSSVFFDYANLRRPIVFYMYDLDHYANELRGFYLGLDELPGPVVRTTPELVDAIRAADVPDAEAAERYERFCERFTYLDDGHAGERVLARVLPAADPGRSS